MIDLSVLIIACKETRICIKNNIKNYRELTEQFKSKKKKFIDVKNESCVLLRFSLIYT